MKEKLIHPNCWQRLGPRSNHTTDSHQNTYRTLFLSIKLANSFWIFFNDNSQCSWTSSCAALETVNRYNLPEEKHVLQVFTHIHGSWPSNSICGNLCCGNGHEWTNFTSKDNTAALFVEIRSSKQPNYPTLKNWLSSFWHSHYIALNVIMIFIMTWKIFLRWN